MTYSLSPYASAVHFNTAFVADYTLISRSPVFSAGTFPILLGTEDPLAEKSVFFGFICSVIYSLSFSDFTLTRFKHFIA